MAKSVCEAFTSADIFSHDRQRSAGFYAGVGALCRSGRAPFSLLIGGALGYQVVSLPVVPPRLAPGMTSSDDCTRGGIPGNCPDGCTGCCALSLRVLVLLLSLRVLLSLRLLLGWPRRR